MELTIRDWMVIIGAALILAVLVDASRRIIRERRSEVRLNARISRAGEHDASDDDFDLLSELPNGGARVVHRDDLQPPSMEDLTYAGQDVEDPADDEVAHRSANAEAPAEVYSDSDESAESASFVTAATASSARTPLEHEGKAHNHLHDEALDDSQPDNTDRDGLTAEAEPSEQPLNRTFDEDDMPSFSALDDDDALDAPPAVTAAKPAPAPKTRGRKQSPASETLETIDWLEQLEVPEPEPEPEARLPRGMDAHVFVLNVVARDREGFSGQDILSILLACDLRFGDMDFFHRHEQSAGRGPIQFSVCNMMKPGVFDIDNMGKLQTRGLMFFVTLPGPDDMLKAFDYMYETAKAVAKNLNGDVLDETRSAVTRQSVEHMRQQIRELERRLAVSRQR